VNSQVPAEHLALLKRHLEAENAHDLGATLETLAPDCEFEDVGSGERWVGRDAVGGYYRTWWAAFDNHVSTEVRHFPAPDLAIVETRWGGRHIGQFWGIEPTGRQIDVTVLIKVPIRGGLMAGEQFFWDRLSLLEQLGVTRIPERLR
jgi:hypothetical protein